MILVDHPFTSNLWGALFQNCMRATLTEKIEGNYEQFLSVVRRKQFGPEQKIPPPLLIALPRHCFKNKCPPRRKMDGP